jgi:hypothetical protein
MYALQHRVVPQHHTSGSHQLPPSGLLSHSLSANLATHREVQLVQFGPRGLSCPRMFSLVRLSELLMPCIDAVSSHASFLRSPNTLI